ncbi:MAG: dTMP kinase [Candidatus Pacebacteria bacterium]|nr:dTMP kinase [Candidatus Paceibacterota bacterium]PIR60429.1 MAG: dTMP kinase [Candidatus Pacebacteria bacterium CG10_big_fil_rev_8_21_14_0_10_44_54]
MKINNPTGLLITLEGGEGGGKTTQIVRLRDKLTAIGKDVVALREPGGTTVSEQIREVVLSAKNAGMAYTTEVLLFQAARAQIYREIVLPSLAAGKVVLMDRSRDSSVVYQGIVRGFGRELIDQLNDISTKQTVPDVTLLLDVPVMTGLARVADAGNNNRMEMQGTDFHDKVREAYLQLAKGDTSGRWQVIDASKSVDEVEAAIWQATQNIFPSAQTVG